MNVAIVGLGLIGGSTGLKLMESGFSEHIIGVDANEKNGARALELGLIDELLSLEEAVSKADLIILAIPVTSMAKVLPGILGQIGEQTVVMDMGSTKATLVQSVKDHPKRSQFVPAHPIAGTENSGPDAAFSTLFDGKTGILCDKDQCDEKAYELAGQCMKALGMHLIHMDSHSHDLHIAYVSHISHISSFVLGQTVLEIEKDEAAIFELAGSGFESTVRLAKSSPQMWAPIFKENKTHISNALEAYIDNLAAFKKFIDEGQDEDLIETMQNANDIRRVLEGISNKAKINQMV